MYLRTNSFFLSQFVIIVFLTITATVTSFVTTNESDSDDGSNNEDWNDSCRDAGYDDGQNGPFQEGTYDHCGDETGGDKGHLERFINGCIDAGNTRDVCESATDA